MPIAKRTLAEKLAKEKEEARERKERSLRALQYQAQSAAAIKLQCAIRRVLAMKVMNEKRRPLTPDEVLAARLKVFLEDRAASRRPGYTYRACTEHMEKAIAHRTCITMP